MENPNYDKMLAHIEELEKQCAESSGVSMETALRENEERYRELFDNISSGVAIYTPVEDGENFIIKDFNKAAEKICLTSKENVMGRKVTDVFPGVRDFGLFDLFKEVLKTGIPKNLPEGHYKDGKLSKWYENFVYRLSSREIVAVFDDVTERKLAEIEINQYKNQLEELVDDRTRELKKAHEKLMETERLAVLGRFAGNLAHEIRNPLSGIASSSYFLKLKLKSEDEKVNFHLDLIKKQVENATKIIESILRLTRMEDLILNPHDLVALINESLSESDIPPAIETVLDFPDSPQCIDCDKEQLKIAFINLIKNSVQAIQETGKITISLKPYPGDPDKFVEIRFTDTGYGIEPNNLDKIFQPLFTTKIYGIGFGLSIVKLIIEKHKGHIDVESSPGKGSAFVIRLKAE